MLLKIMIEVDNVKLHADSILCPKGYAGITLFGHVFTCYKKDYLKEYVKTSRGKRFVNHENIHCIQARSLKGTWLIFYILYIFYWIKNLFTIGFNHKAYREIPFEKEAYANEWDFNYKESKWKNYI